MNDLMKSITFHYSDDTGLFTDLNGLSFGLKSVVSKPLIQIHGFAGPERWASYGNYIDNKIKKWADERNIDLNNLSEEDYLALSMENFR
jgi:hypothetical protein